MIIINSKEKKIYLFEIIFLIIAIALAATAIYFLINPAYEAKKARDNERESVVNEIVNKIVEKFNEEEVKLSFNKIVPCNDEFTKIGFGNNEVDLKSALDIEMDIKEDEYEICRSFDSDFIMVRAVNAETKTIEITRKL